MGSVGRPDRRRGEENCGTPGDSRCAGDDRFENAFLATGGMHIGACGVEGAEPAGRAEGFLTHVGTAQQRGDDCEQFARVDRVGEVRVGAAQQTLGAVVGFDRGRGDMNHGYPFSGGVRSNRFADLVSAHVGQVDIENGNVDWCFGEKCERLGAGCDGNHVESGSVQPRSHQVSAAVVVVDHEGDERDDVRGQGHVTSAEIARTSVSRDDWVRSRLEMIAAAALVCCRRSSSMFAAVMTATGRSRHRGSVLMDANRSVPEMSGRWKSRRTMSMSWRIKASRPEAPSSASSTRWAKGASICLTMARNPSSSSMTRTTPIPP